MPGRGLREGDGGAEEKEVPAAEVLEQLVTKWRMVSEAA